MRFKRAAYAAGDFIPAVEESDNHNTPAANWKLESLSLTDTMLVAVVKLVLPEKPLPARVDWAPIPRPAPSKQLQISRDALKAGGFAAQLSNQTVGIYEVDANGLVKDHSIPEIIVQQAIRKALVIKYQATRTAASTAGTLNKANETAKNFSIGKMDPAFHPASLYIGE